MPVLPRLTSFFRTLTRGPRLDAELDDELRAYVDLLTEEKIAAGLTPEAARRAALVEVGGVEQVKERVRDVRVGVWLDTAWQDVRYAVRGFRRSPWFTATAVASLAIGIGFNAAIFSALDAVLFQPLPYKDPERIVEITMGDFSNEVSGVLPGQFDEWEHGATLFERMGVADWHHATAALRRWPHPDPDQCPSGVVGLSLGIWSPAREGPAVAASGRCPRVERRRHHVRRVAPGPARRHIRARPLGEDRRHGVHDRRDHAGGVLPLSSGQPVPPADDGRPDGVPTSSSRIPGRSSHGRIATAGHCGRLAA